MTTAQLIGKAPGELLRERQATLAEDLVTRQFAARPELAARYGPTGREKCRQDANYHLSYLADAMDAGDPELFATYVAWAKTMLATRRIPPEDLARHLALTRTIISEGVADVASRLAVEYLTSALERLPSFSTHLPTCLQTDGPQAGLASDYLDALLKGERHVASRLILDAVAAGVSVKLIYLHVFQPALYEVGRLWQVNQISVAQEHYCTAATQLIMSQLYTYIFASEKNDDTLVATCIAGDLHEIGVRMVCDFFEMAGWNTFYLGADMPSPAVVDTVAQRRAHVLLISVTLSPHVRAARLLIEKLRAHPDCQRVKILIGGHPFLASPDLWKKVGADGTAANAQAAIELLDRLMVHDPA